MSATNPTPEGNLTPDDLAPLTPGETRRVRQAPREHRRGWRRNPVFLARLISRVVLVALLVALLASHWVVLSGHLTATSASTVTRTGAGTPGPAPASPNTLTPLRPAALAVVLAAYDTADRHDRARVRRANDDQSNHPDPHGHRQRDQHQRDGRQYDDHGLERYPTSRDGYYYYPDLGYTCQEQGLGDFLCYAKSVDPRT